MNDPEFNNCRSIAQIIRDDPGICKDCKLKHAGSGDFMSEELNTSTDEEQETILYKQFSMQMNVEDKSVHAKKKEKAKGMGQVPAKLNLQMIRNISSLIKWPFAAIGNLVDNAV